MNVKWAPAATAAARGGAKRLPGILSLLLIVSLTACSSITGTSPKEVRKLAGNPQAQEGRKTAEEHLRAIAHAYSKNTPLTLGLVVVNDRCNGGAAKQWLDPNPPDQYKIRCRLWATAYYGADPHRIGTVLDGILTAGDHESPHGAIENAIPFDHDDYKKRLVDYYQGQGPNPNGPNTLEPTSLPTPLQDLSWDTVRSSQKKLIEEPATCAASDPPVTRCLREPAAKTVADIRKKYGMVFKLEIYMADYYNMSKDSKTVKTWR